MILAHKNISLERKIIRNKINVTSEDLSEDSGFWDGCGHIPFMLLDC